MSENMTDSINMMDIIDTVLNNIQINRPKYNQTKIIYEFKKSDKGSVLFQIKDNKLKILKINKLYNNIYHPPRLIFISSLIKETLKKYNVNDMLFIITLEDTITKNISIPYLGTLYHKEYNSVPTPITWGNYFSNNSKKYNDFLFNSKVAEYQTFFNKKKLIYKKNKIVFRGTNNHNKRNILYNLGKLDRNNLDVGFGNTNYIPMNKLLEDNKFFFIVRGGGPFSGSLNQYLCSNGIIFYVEEDFKQITNLFLKPYKNYVPINTNFSNFWYMIKLKEFDIINKIYENNNIFIKLFYNSETIKYYMFKVLSTLYEF